MENIIIDGTITTVGPLSMQMPGGGDYDGFPCMWRAVGTEGEVQQTGYLPGTTVRGFLRRAVVVREMKLAAQAGKPYSLHKAYAELIGQDAASEQPEEHVSLEAIKERRDESHVIDLFGCGLRVAGRLRVGHFVPEVNVLPNEYKGVRKDLDTTEGVIESFSEEVTAQFYARQEASRKLKPLQENIAVIKKKITGAKDNKADKAGFEKELEQTEKMLKKCEEDCLGMLNSSLHPDAGYYALPIDLDLPGRIVILNPRDGDLELIEYGLDCLSRAPVFGAQSARGCGEIKGEFDIKIDGEIKKKITIGDYVSSKVDVF